MRIGIDLGGTKIEGIVLDSDKSSGSLCPQNTAANLEEIARIRKPTPRGSYQQLLQAITDLVIELERCVGQQCSVGIGGPGSVNAQQLIRNANTTELNGQPLIADLKRKLNRAIRYSNDANCFALAETRIGIAQSYSTVFGVILGTGVGGGLVVNNKLLHGANSIAGEWGHNSMPWLKEEEIQQTRPCYCGKSHCIETYLSGPGLSLSYERTAKQSLSVETIVQAAENNDAVAEQVLRDYEHQLARALAGVINIVDPDCIVLGGGLSNISRLYQNIPRIWQHYIFSEQIDTQLLPPAGGDSAGVKGAAWLWD